MTDTEYILEVLSKADHDTLTKVIEYLEYGMFDEWDIELGEGILEGFCGPEIQIAAKSALSKYKYDREIG